MNETEQALVVIGILAGVNVLACAYLIATVSRTTKRTYAEIVFGMTGLISIYGLIRLSLDGLHTLSIAVTVALVGVAIATTGLAFKSKHIKLRVALWGIGTIVFVCGLVASILTFPYMPEI